MIGYLVKLNSNRDPDLKLNFLQEVKSKHILESTSDSKYSLDIVCLSNESVENSQNIIVSERNEGSLMKLSLDAQLISESNLKNEFKNSCGICVNYKKEIFVTDGKLNKIFKFNSNLRLIQIIGSYLGTRYGSLNFPWGITTDIENDDSVYLCDNGNDRILVFNPLGAPKAIISFENCHHPRKIQINHNLIYVLHKNDDDIFVSIIDKNNHQLMNSIKQNQINIKSFYIDNRFNVITIGQLSSDSAMQYLICTRQNGEHLFKTVLNLEYIVWDFCFRVTNIDTNEEKIQMICATNEGLVIVNF